MSKGKIAKVVTAIIVAMVVVYMAQETIMYYVYSYMRGGITAPAYPSGDAMESMAITLMHTSAMLLTMSLLIVALTVWIIYKTVCEKG